MSALHALVTLAAAAASEEETSKTAYYLLGGLLALTAVAVGSLGIRRHRDWPASKGTRNALCAFVALLVVAVCASAVATA